MPGAFPKARRKITQRVSAVAFLRAVLLTVVLWCEFGVFSWSVSDCRWPELRGNRKLSSDGAPWAHVLLIADPQVLDHRSYPGRPYWLWRLTQFFVDFNLRKSWRVAKSLQPQVVIFLGDMTDGGRFAMSAGEYETYISRFMHIFRTSAAIPVYYLPGNHDVGLGNAQLFSPEVKERFRQHFGPLNQVIDINSHRIVFVDAPDLVDEDYRRHATGKSFDQWRGSKGGAIEFVKQHSADTTNHTTILLSHIPLSRPETARCGPLREKGGIHRGVGFGYQNVLGKDTSNFLMGFLRPSIIFSGDDHDYCDFTHYATPQHLPPVREVTVKSFSMAMGIRRPGFQLLSLPTLNPSKSASLMDAPCHLPYQVGLYTQVYVPVIVLSLVFLVVRVLIRSRYNSQGVPTALSLRGDREGRRARPSLAIAPSESEDSDTNYDAPSKSFELPPLTSRSLMTATLMPLSKRGSPSSSPYLRPSDNLSFANGNTADDLSDFDGLDSISYLPTAASHSRAESLARSGSWVGTSRRKHRPQKWRITQFIGAIIGRLRRPSTRVTRKSAIGLIWADVLGTAWPPILLYFVISILSFS